MIISWGAFDARAAGMAVLRLAGKSGRNGAADWEPKAMTWDEVVAIAKGLPGVEEGPSYGTPGLKVRGKFLTRLRLEDDSLVFTEVGFDERELLLEADPQTFHLTPHYAPYPTILARLERVDAATVRLFLERRWRKVAPKALVKDFQGWTVAPPD